MALSPRGSAMGSHTESAIPRRFAEVAGNVLEADRQRARAVIEECRTGNLTNFGFLKGYGASQETQKYFHISPQEWNQWNAAYRKSQKPAGATSELK